jgi:hypothetical protein
VVELDDGHGDGVDQKMINFTFGKEEREKQKWAQGKGICDRTIFVLHSRHHRGCEWLRINSRTMKRGVSQLKQLSSATR